MYRPSIWVEKRTDLGIRVRLEGQSTIIESMTNTSFAIQEEEKIFGADTITSYHSRCKSSNEELTGNQGSHNHPRLATESDLDSSKLVNRKTAISFESYADEMLDDVIQELAHLQPRRPSV